MASPKRQITRTISAFFFNFTGILGTSKMPAQEKLGSQVIDQVDNGVHVLVTTTQKESRGQIRVGRGLRAHNRSGLGL